MRAGRAALVVLPAVLGVLLLPGTAQAHPLGNFTVNHYDGLTLTPDAVTLTAVVDRAEIPTAQELQQLPGNGAPSQDQLRTGAADECPAVADALHLSVDGREVSWDVRSATAELRPGAAGLPTMRLTCALHAGVGLDGASTVAFRDDYQTDRVGWREITATGRGVRLLDSPVPVDSISDQLRSYPGDLLASPLDLRSFTVTTRPGVATGDGATVRPATGDPFSAALAGLDRRVQDLIGRRDLTPLAGTLAVVLAVLLGCGHALLPGHGKTVIAAYLAGRRGRRRDAVTIGATVTTTHTVGVLLLGLALSVSSTLAGDQVLRWLGVASGVLVTGIGAAMLRAALRRARPAVPVVQPEPALVGAVVGAGRHHHEHGHHNEHGHHHEHGHDHHHDHHDHDHPHAPVGRAGLVGMGAAGGLVPSPSALVVLLASVALGRTVFGVVLVLAYGVGMAATLTVAGLALIRLEARLSRRGTARWAAVARVLPVATAALVLLVGLALAVRGLAA